MNTIDFIKEVEQNYQVKSIKINDMEIWPFLRSSYYFAFRDKHEFKIHNEKNKISWLKVNRIKNVFYGFFSLFKKYDYIVLSNVSAARLMKGKYANRLADQLISELGKEKVLYIENPVGGNHYKKSNLSVENIISLDLFLIFRYIPITKRKFTISNEDILKEINKKYHININYKKLILKFLYYKNIFKIFFQLYKPKSFFLSESYNLVHKTALFSANKIGIKTVELQHGVINDSHPAYNVFVKLERTFFPDYLLTFGDYVKQIFHEKNFFIKQHNIFPIGSLYLDYINNEYEASKNTMTIFSNFRNTYKKIVAISSQLTIENALINFLIKSASLNNNILYIFVPRNVDKDYSKTKFPDNITILKHLNIYQIIKEADFHATVYSTCALEAPGLGVPNILINIENMAQKYYSKLLQNRDTTIFVETEEEFVNLIMNWHTKPKNEIKKMHNYFYAQNHKECLRQALDLIQK